MQHKGVESTGFLRGALLNQVLLLHGKLFLYVCETVKINRNQSCKARAGDRLNILRSAKLDPVVKSR